MIISKNSFFLFLCVGLVMISGTSKGMRPFEINIKNIKSAEKKIASVKFFQKKESFSAGPRLKDYQYDFKYGNLLDEIAGIFKIDKLFNEIVFKDTDPIARKVLIRSVIESTAYSFDEVNDIIESLKKQLKRVTENLSQN